MFRKYKAARVIICELLILAIFSSILIKQELDKQAAIYASLYDTDKNFIKWVDFDICAKALDKAYKYDVQSQTEAVKINWIELLACLGARYGGDFFQI
jgi:hypothetical protein